MVDFYLSLLVFLANRTQIKQMVLLLVYNYRRFCVSRTRRTDLLFFIIQAIIID